MALRIGDLPLDEPKVLPPPTCGECRSFDPIGYFEEVGIGKFKADASRCSYHKKRVVSSWFAPNECFYAKRGR